MPGQLAQTALMRFLSSANEVYHAKILELRDAVEGWLAYIPQTFPHYTRHTVQHSDEIVSQLSKLLFGDDDPSRPVVAVSALEAYVLAAGAYLHDAGMVVSDSEKAEILSSEAWQSWTTGQGGGAKRWGEVQTLRRGPQPTEDDLRYFLADIQVRFLIAEFIRRTHHRRSADLLTQHQPTLGRFAFDDPMLLRTIADVCLAHGLRQHELNDAERYPERRDTRGETINVRFAAILLRLGDLLDMSSDRACPLLLNAACPLPAGSLAHWTQYQRITHRLTAPDRIELIAECTTQEEHRVLQDWCQWLVDELREAGNLMAHAARHHDWVPPEAGLGEPGPTIIIRPAPGATYIPSKWTLELDHDAVFERLIKDTHADPRAFVRELIQNALDASRCQMYADILRDGGEPPEFPTQVDEERRRRYPVHIRLQTRNVQNKLSGEVEARQVLVVDDRGIGMDKEVIQRYFLQVGRSYYTTDEFRRSFRFVPTSRFGVGFLSVFGASDHVTVDTFKPSSSQQDEPIRLTLTGPRNYLLTDRGQRREGGTRIAVLLREPMEQGELTKIASGWCRRVEFPVVVDDLGLQVTIEAERPEQFTYEMPDVTEEGARFCVRVFPVDRHGIEGDLYVFAHTDARGESWAARSWARYQYPKEHPRAVVPPFPPSLACLHGLATDEHSSWREQMVCRIDYRRDVRQLTLSRALLSDRLDPDIRSRWEEILAEHLATSKRASGEDGWKYRQALAEEFPIASFWASVPETVRVYVRGAPRLMSLKEVMSLDELVSTVPGYGRPGESDESVPARDCEVPVIAHGDITFLFDAHRNAVFEGREPRDVRFLSTGELVVTWSLCGEPQAPFFETDLEGVIWLVALPDPTALVLSIHKTTDNVLQTLLLNKHHPFAQWLVRAKDACREGRCGLKQGQFTRLLSLLRTPLSHRGYERELLAQYLEGWRELPDLPAELYPPEIEWSGRSFVLRDPGDTREKG